jgi:uncharacterized membrane protein
MAWLLGFLGAVFGLMAGATGEWALGLVGGAAIGALFGSWLSTRDRLSTLEQRLRIAETRPWQRPEATPAAPVATAAPAATGTTEPAAVVAVPISVTRTEPVPAKPAASATVASDASAQKDEILSAHLRATPSATITSSTESSAAEPRSTQTPADVSQTESPVGAAARAAARAADRRENEEAWARATAAPEQPRTSATPSTANEVSGFWRWFGEGNWVLKVGLGLLFIGVGAFFRYAARQGWLTFPIEYRYIAVAIAAIAALGLGWKQRHKRPVFALNLQGGAIGILLLTVFSAYKLHGFLSSEMTFTLLLVLVAGCAVLAILQNSLGLAVFGIIGGFAAPILASTGSGNHVALFSYYALLNLAIIAISWSKGWRILNLLGFLFTFVIGAVWGERSYQPELFGSTEPFLILFFLMYLLIPLLPALRNPDPETRDRVDGSLVFGTPLIGFGLQASLLQNDRFGLAWSALILAAVYALLAWWVWRHAGLARWRKAYAGLSLVFATLTVPLALSARWTSAVWAVEGALLVWLGIHQDERRLRWAGLLMQALGGASLLIAVGDHWPAHQDHAFAFGALLVTIAGLFSAVQYQRHGASQSLTWMLAGWSFVWWYIAGMVEIERHAPDGREVDIALLFLTLTGLLGALLRRVLAFRPFGWPAHFGLLLALPLVAMMTLAHDTPLSDQGWQAWLIYGLASLITLRILDRDGSPGVAWSHAFWWLAAPVIAWIEIRDWLDMQSNLGEGWRIAALSLPVLLPLGLMWKRVSLAGFPVVGGIEGLRRMLMPIFAVAAVLIAAVILTLPGGSEPLPWLPILNPLELTQIAAVLMVVRLIADGLNEDLRDSGIYTLVLAFGFVALSAATLRATHHLGGEAWGAGMLTHALPQSALSIVWTLLGIIAMLIGARHARRATWIAGASVLGLVLAKLLLIDMRFLGDLWGIVSLLGVGALFVAVGFFAPMPPRERDEGSSG